MPLTLMEGNEAIARGAVAAGCRFFAGYPITPATTILNHMLAMLPPLGGVCIQGEDEIASIGFCLGASMAGMKVMTATSGPGISLYSEQISFAVGSEIPIVIVDIQRLGPSTGSATRGADGDVQFLRWGNSGGMPVIVLAPTDVRGARHYYVRSGDVMPVEDVLHLMLIASDNAAAKALARTSAMGYDGFMERMNSKAQELGLESTRYADPSGLNSGNVSSALDMARLIAFASNDERIASIMRKNDYRVTTKRRTLVVHNTNRLIGSEVEVQGGKTGFIRDAGYCLATLLKLPQGDPVAVVVLGARSSAGRFMETRHLFNWVAGKTQQVLGGTPKEQ